MAKRRTEKIIGFIFWVIGSALFVTSMLTNLWISSPPDLKFGLFDYCFKHCGQFEWLYGPEKIIFLHVFIPRMLLLCGAGFVALGVLIGILDLCNNAACPIRTEGILDILGGFTIIIGCAIFTSRNFDAVSLQSFVSEVAAGSLPGFSTFQDGGHFNFSFYFGWISGLLYIVAGICYIIAGKKNYHR